MNPPANGQNAPQPQNPTNEDNAPANQPAQAPTFTQEQVDRMISDRLARQAASSEKRFNDALQGLGFEGGMEGLTQYVSEKQQREQDAEARRLERLAKEGNFEKLLAEEKALHESAKADYKAELEALRGELTARDEAARRSRISSALLDEAAKRGLINPSQVVSLLSGRVTVTESGQVVALGENGEPRINGASGFVGVDALLDEFAQQNPHFVPAAPGRGANSRPSGGPPVSDGVDLSNTDINYIMKHQKAFEDAARKGLLHQK